MSTMLADATAKRTGDYPIAIGYPRVRRPRIAVVPERRCFAIQGLGVPGGPEFQEAMGALYGAAYSLHFVLRDRGLDTHTGPTEGLWERLDGQTEWSEGAVAFDPAAWRWTLLLPIPFEAREEDLDAALSAARRRRPVPALDRLRIITLAEGLVVEAMHVGPYVTEPETIATMHALAESAHLVPAGSHHEIYLGDPKRTAPERLRTVLRQPVKPAV